MSRPANKRIPSKGADVPVYSEIFKKASDAELEFDKRLAEIVAQGFTFKLGTYYDTTTGVAYPVRIP